MHFNTYISLSEILWLRSLIWWFCLDSKSFISSCSCLDYCCSLACSSSNSQNSLLNRFRCSYENKTASYLSFSSSLSSQSSPLKLSTSLNNTASRSPIYTNLSRSYLSSFSIQNIFDELDYNYSTLKLAFANCYSFFRNIYLLLTSFNSYYYFSFAYRAQKAQNLASFFLAQLAILLELERCWLSLRVFCFQSFSMEISCSFVQISFPSCYESIFTSDCCLSIFLSRQVTASLTLSCSSSGLLVEGGSAMISLRTCLTRLFVDDLREFITTIIVSHTCRKHRQ